MNREKREEWEGTADSEIASVKATDTWNSMARSDEMLPLHMKSVFKTNTDGEKTFERYKACMVAYGNEQRFGGNHMLTFAAIMDMIRDKDILALAVNSWLPACHSDVPNAYVKASTELGPGIFFHIPQGMKISNKVLQRLGVKQTGQMLLLLRRTQYGVKQAGRLWAQLLHLELPRVHFIQRVTDPCLDYIVRKVA